MLFIIVFSRQKQHFIPNTGNLTKGKQISLLLDPVKYSNGNEELQVKENNLHLKKEENIIFDNWTKPSNTLTLQGTVRGQNGKGQCGAQIACNHWTAALSGEDWAEQSTTGLSEPKAKPQRSASHGQPLAPGPEQGYRSMRSSACTILQLWYRPKGKKGPSSPKHRYFFWNCGR